MKKIIIASFVGVGFIAWYIFGFWGVYHPASGKNSVNSYATRRAALQKLVVDPTILYPVTRVIDGDTFVARMDGEDVTVRVLGENAPETVKPKSPVECYGPEASEEDKSLLSGRSVFLQIDPTQDKVDFYGRLLAYVRRDDGLFLEEHMISEGFAREYTFDAKKPYQYQKEFQMDQAEAQTANRGLWGKCK